MKKARLGNKFIRELNAAETEPKPCIENHIWDIPNKPDEPVLCICCGAEFVMSEKERTTVRLNVEDLIKHD